MAPQEEHHFPANVLEAFKEAFGVFDSNQDGNISVDELGKVMNKLGLHPCSEELSDIINEFDRDGDKMIDFQEFLHMMTQQLKTTDNISECKAIFEVFDIDKNDFIDINELRQIFAIVGEKISEEELEVMMAEADKDGDGQISYEEFKTIMINLA